MKADADELNKRFGVLLRACRKENKLTQNQLAIAVGKSISTIRGWERGAVNPSFSMIKIIADKLNIDASELFVPDLTKKTAKTKILIDIISLLSPLPEIQMLKAKELLEVYMKNK